MSTIVHAFDWPDRFIIGTVGRPGARTFYLQVRSGPRVVSVAIEKEQSGLLAEKIDEILDELMTSDGNPFSVPATPAAALVDNEPLDQPLDEQFRAGTLSLGWDPATAQLVVEAYPLAEPTEDREDPEPAELLVVRIPVGTARAFAQRGREVYASGRPICPFCGEPMDPEGHVCTSPGGMA